MINMFLSALVPLNGCPSAGWRLLIRRRFLRNFACTTCPSVCLSTRVRVYVHICMDAYVRSCWRARALRAINNANGFRQRCQEIMLHHGWVNKIQKNCSISRLRIAYLLRLGRYCARAAHSSIMYIYLAQHIARTRATQTIKQCTVVKLI